MYRPTQKMQRQRVINKHSSKAGNAPQGAPLPLARLAAAFLLLAAILGACSRRPVYPPAATIGRDAVILVSELKPDTPLFRTYRFEGKNINFFVVLTGGRILSFLDACASCYPHKLGYRSEHGAVACNDCGTTVPLSGLERGIGSCHPLKLPGRLEQGKYLIPKAELEAAVDKF